MQTLLSEAIEQQLQSLSQDTGRLPEDLLREGLELVAERHRLERRRERFARAAGMWKDRDDLPDFGAMRREFDRTWPSEEPS